MYGTEHALVRLQGTPPFNSAQEMEAVVTVSAATVESGSLRHAVSTTRLVPSLDRTLHLHNVKTLLISYGPGEQDKIINISSPAVNHRPLLPTLLRTKWRN